MLIVEVLRRETMANSVCPRFNTNACLHPMFTSGLCGVFSDSKIHGANMGPIWVLSVPYGPYAGVWIRTINISYSHGAKKQQPEIELGNVQSQPMVALKFVLATYCVEELKQCVMHYRMDCHE